MQAEPPANALTLADLQAEAAALSAMVADVPPGPVLNTSGQQLTTDNTQLGYWTEEEVKIKLHFPR